MILNMAAVGLHGTESSQHVIFLFIFLQVLVIRGKRHASLKDAEGPEVEIDLDLLQPYAYFHGPRHKNRYVRDCQPAKYGNITHSLHRAHADLSLDLPVVEQRRFVKDIGQYAWDTHPVYGHQFIVNNPQLSISVLEPGGEGGCMEPTVATVVDSAKQKSCLVAVNAGLFNTTSHHCIGNVVSDGKEAHNSGGIQNAHFGITKNGSLYFGYIPEDHQLEDHFSQLVGGVIWLVREGEIYVDQSKEAECSDSQETGNLQTFIDVQSARTAVGHNTDGQVIILQVEGKSWKRGASLYDLAELMLELGAVNAINLDGGGSSSAVVDGVLVNYPSDSCSIRNFTYGCARQVSTVLCVHDLPCSEDCNGHGDCIHGQCHCRDMWAGPVCDSLQCGETNCSNHGNCTAGGCDCEPGWLGAQCKDVCAPGWHGHHCRQPCRCPGGRHCSPHTGRCYCPPGYIGFHCEQECPYGSYGEGCRGVCDCLSSCGCDHVTGSCHLISSNSTMWQVGHCLGQHIIVESQKVVMDPQEIKIWFVSLVTMCLVTIASLVVNVALVCTTCHHRKRTKSRKLKPPKGKTTYRPSLILDSSSADDEFSDGSFENIAMRNFHPEYSQASVSELNAENHFDNHSPLSPLQSGNKMNVNTTLPDL